MSGDSRYSDYRHSQAPEAPPPRRRRRHRAGGAGRVAEAPRPSLGG
ncbi:hypothetical protein ACFPM0_33290 [Pseudonocardia sulfidoxydans]